MDWLIEKFKKADDKLAIISNNTEFSYGYLATKIEQYIDNLKSNIPTGKVVAIISDYNFYSIALFFSLIKNQNIIIPLLSSATPAEIEKKLAISNTEHIITLDRLGELTFEKRKVDKIHSQINHIQNERVAGLILFSSGITGEPKAMVHNLTAIINTFKDKKTNNLSILIFLLFDHIGGLNTLLSGLSGTSTLVLVKSRKPDAICQLIQDYKVNILPTTPTFLNLLLISKVYENYNTSSLKLITYGTEFISESLLQRLKATFPRIRFIQTFGTSETGIYSTKSYSSNSNLIKIVDADKSFKVVDGVLYLKSNTQVSGYLNEESDKFDENGWFNTGDIVEETEDGYLKILSRKDEVINVGGEKVFPSEIENLLMQLAPVLDCIVYGKANAITGQSVVADVVIQDNLDKVVVKKEIRMFFLQNVASFKVPTKINFINKTKYNDRFKKIRKASHEKN